MRYRITIAEVDEADATEIYVQTVDYIEFPRSSTPLTVSLPRKEKGPYAATRESRGGTNGEKSWESDRRYISNAQGEPVYRAMT